MADAADTDELPLFANDEAKHVFSQIEQQRKVRRPGPHTTLRSRRLCGVPANRAL
jgi:hypothetical protein